MRLGRLLALAAVLAALPAALSAQQPRPPAQQPAPAPQPSVQQQAPKGNVSTLQPGAIIVVDVQEIMRSAAAARSIQTQLDAQRATYQEDVNKKEADLRKLEQELTQQRLVLAEDAFNQRRRDFEAKVNDVQRDVQNRKRQLDQAFEDNMNKVRAALLDVIEQLASEAKIALVLPRSNVVLADRALDFTTEVQTRLDKKLPSIKVSLPPLKP